MFFFSFVFLFTFCSICSTAQWNRQYVGESVFIMAACFHDMQHRGFDSGRLAKVDFEHVKEKLSAGHHDELGYVHSFSWLRGRAPSPAHHDKNPPLPTSKISRKYANVGQCFAQEWPFFAKNERVFKTHEVFFFLDSFEISTPDPPTKTFGPVHTTKSIRTGEGWGNGSLDVAALILWYI